MFTLGLALYLLVVPTTQAQFTPIDRAKAWELVKIAIPDAARGCEKEILKNNRGDGIVIRCGAPNPDPLAPTPMIFVVLDGRAYAASLSAGAVTELPDLSVSEEARQRSGFSSFVEVIQRKGSRGLETSWHYFYYDPRPVVCFPGLAPKPAAGFVPAQRPREAPEQVVTREILDLVRVVESRGRVIVLAEANENCQLTVDKVSVQDLDGVLTAHVSLRVVERSAVAYEETLKRDGEDADEIGEDLAEDVLAFLRSNYDRLSRRGQSPSKSRP